jgi:hypothetical protein
MMRKPLDRAMPMPLSSLSDGELATAGVEGGWEREGEGERMRDRERGRDREKQRESGLQRVGPAANKRAAALLIQRRALRGVARARNGGSLAADWWRKLEVVALAEGGSKVSTLGALPVDMEMAKSPWPAYSSRRRFTAAVGAGGGRREVQGLPLARRGNGHRGCRGAQAQQHGIPVCDSCSAR